MSLPTVKVRAHHGTKSADLTIPVKVVKENDINEGDIFSLDVADNKNGRVILTYTRIFKQKG